MYQKFIAIGNLAADPELRYTEKGEPVASFRMAVNGISKEEGKQPLWLRVSVFGNQAEPCAKYLSKGKKVFVEGRISYDEKTGAPRLWTRQDGTIATSLEMVASSVKFLSPAGESGEHTATEEVF